METHNLSHLHRDILDEISKDHSMLDAAERFQRPGEPATDGGLNFGRLILGLSGFQNFKASEMRPYADTIQDIIDATANAKDGKLAYLEDTLEDAFVRVVSENAGAAYMVIPTPLQIRQIYREIQPVLITAVDIVEGNGSLYRYSVRDFMTQVTNNITAHRLLDPEVRQDARDAASSLKELFEQTLTHLPMPPFMRRQERDKNNELPGNDRSGGGGPG